MKEVTLIRLTSGEELIGKVEVVMNSHGEPDLYKIEHPVVIIPTGEGRITFAPYMPYTTASTGLSIKSSHVMFTAIPVPELAMNYSKAVSPILTPSNKIVGV